MLGDMPVAATIRSTAIADSSARFGRAFRLVRESMALDPQDRRSYRGSTRLQSMHSLIAAIGSHGQAVAVRAGSIEPHQTSEVRSPYD